MTATPDSFSMADLEALMENAPSEPEVITDPEEQAQERIVSIAEDALNFATELSAGPVVHKVMLHMIAQKMMQWHTDIGARMMDDGEYRSAMGWSRDAGKFQAILNILDTISVDNDDFTCVCK